MSSKTKLVNAEEVMAENLDDPAFRAYWERTALARAVALWLVNYRVEHGLSQAALARLLGMQQPAIARLEAGEQNPRFDTLLRLADMLGMELHLDVTPPGKTQSLRRQRLRYRMPRGRVVQRVTTGRGTRLRVTAR